MTNALFTGATTIKIFMRKVLNSQFKNAGYTGKLPRVEDRANDPHGEIKTAAKQRIKKDSAKNNKNGTNEGSINIKKAI